MSRKSIRLWEDRISHSKWHLSQPVHRPLMRFSTSHRQRKQPRPKQHRPYLGYRLYQRLVRMEPDQRRERVGQFRIGNKCCDTSSNGCYYSDMPRSVNMKMEGALSHLTVPV